MSCLKTRAETNLLIVGLNVPVGGGMSYFSLHVAETETEEERRKQYLGTAGYSGAKHRRVTLHQAGCNVSVCALRMHVL